MKSKYAKFFFPIWVFFHNHSWITGLKGKGESISLTPQYHFYPVHRYLDISRAINAESSPLHIASSWTRTGNLWCPSASRNDDFIKNYDEDSGKGYMLKDFIIFIVIYPCYQKEWKVINAISLYVICMIKKVMLFT